MNPKEQTAKTPSSTTGLFALLSSLPRVKGTGAGGRALIAQGSAAPSTGRPTLLFLPALVLAFLAFTATPALAAAPEAPVTAAPAAKSSSAVLQGVVNPLKLATVSWFFEYKAGAVCTGGSSTPVEGPAEVEAQPVTAGVEGLTPGTEYTVCLLAENAAKEVTSGTPVSFTTVPAPLTDTPAPITATTATLEGHFTLDSTASTQYSFDYKAGGECTGGEIAPNPASEAGTGTGEVAESLEISGLQPGAQYTVCFVASNAFGSEQGAPVTFRALAVPPTIAPESESTTEVTATSAKLNAEVDPGGAETTYHFEYDTSPYTTSAPHGQSTAESPLLASDNNTHPAVATITGLTATTEYHYRIVARNAQSPAGGTPGLDHTFRTQPKGGPLVLPDGRAYEMVSPPVKDGAEIIGIVGSPAFSARARGAPGGSAAVQASAEGTRVTYLASSPIGDHPPGNHYATQLLSSRGPSGWTTENITTPAPNFTRFQWDEGEEYRLFSADLSHAVLQTASQTFQAPLDPEIHQETNQDEIYVRDNIAGTFKAVLPEAELASPGAGDFVGASPDLGGVVYNNGNLWERLHGEPKLINRLPNEELAPGASLARGVTEDGGQHAISNDGTQVAWTGGAGNLYTRNLTSETTVQVDSAAGGSESGGGEFQAANADGSRVFFTDPRDLINPEDAGGLLMFDLHTGALTDITPDPAGAKVRTVLGASEDGTSMYIVAKGVLPGTTPNAENTSPTEGENNIYNIREAPLGSETWHATFIATLPKADAEVYFESNSKPSGNSGHPGETPLDTAVRVSPHGSYLAFMSAGDLTGYDNRDLSSGAAVEEVYLYGATANQLVCASCKPTGARPVGELDTGSSVGEEAGALPMDPLGVWASRGFSTNHWVSALIPAWNQNRMPNGGFGYGSLYESRVLSDAGRLFFDSADALVPQDVNGKEDVYEYEPAGVGSCAGESGCVGLISAGQGDHHSVFVDASADGGDVFFTTSDRLVTQDQDTSTDIYDAHVCTTAAPCFPVAAAGPPPCGSTDGCRPAQTQQPGVFAAPPSATFSGAGNVSPAPAAKGTVRPKTAAQVRAEKLAKALKACRKLRGHKRAACTVRARKKYGNAKPSGRRIK